MNDDAPRGRWLWKALPWGLHTACSECGELVYCHGRSRERMVCLSCFAANGHRVKLRRSGQTGKRKQYAYRARRPRSRTIDLVRDLRNEGKTIGAIRRELGLGESTVKKYLQGADPLKNGRFSAQPCGEIGTEKNGEGVCPSGDGRPGG